VCILGHQSASERQHHSVAGRSRFNNLDARILKELKNQKENLGTNACANVSAQKAKKKDARVNSGAKLHAISTRTRCRRSL